MAGEQKELASFRKELAACQREQNHTLQVLSQAVHGLLGASVTQLSQLRAIRAHQIMYEVPQEVPHASCSHTHSSAPAATTLPATKAARLSIKRSQQWENRSLRRKHLQQNLQAQGQLASDSNTAVECDGTANVTGAVPGVPAAASAVPVRTCAAGAHGQADHPDSHAESSEAPAVSQPQPPGPGCIRNAIANTISVPRLAAGIPIPGTDVPPWQDLKWAAFTNIGGDSHQTANLLNELLDQILCIFQKSRERQASEAPLP